MRARSLPSLVACAIIATSGVSLADNAATGAAQRDVPPTHVLGFVAGDQFDQAEALTRATKKAIEQSTNQRLASGDFSLEVLTAALGCPEKPDAPCLKKIATKISSRRFLWGSIAVDGTRVDAELQLFGDESNDKKVKFSYQTSVKDSPDGALLGVAADAVSRLFEPLRYRVAVKSNESTGSVFVDGKETAQLINGEASLELTAGEHQFQLSSSTKKLVAEQSMRVPNAETTSVSLDRSAAAPAAADLPATATPADKPPIEDFTAKVNKHNPQRTWGYITLGAGGVLLAGGLGSAAWLYALNHKDNFQTYRNGLSTNEDACTEADHGRSVPGAMSADDVRALCSKASALQIAEIVLLAGGVAAAGTGLTLLLTSKSDKSASTTTVEPRIVVGRGRTDVGVFMRF